ncbi:unnamed protein product, partial [Polarella glacialis]
LVAGSPVPHRFFASVRLLDKAAGVDGVPLPRNLVLTEESSAMNRFYFSLQDLRDLAEPLGWTVEVPARTSFLDALTARGQRLVVFRAA